ncbi:uncharacterized protein LOC126368499 [Pectinophora gossypiella]|uniref:uncharacterized protein LOC126368499 n=1 Tax=Pectinophora gossypiella TaxID=13191 RepID=UPI00214E3534|nr:uncharacterized protein LOC126368499 [Pectinophora gossypiella]
MLKCVRLCSLILFFCSIKCDDLPEDLIIIPNSNVINFNEFEVIKYVCIAGNRTTKYTANLFWYQIMSTVGALPVLRARNDVKYTAENSDSKRLELNISLLKDSNMSKIYCLQRYFDWDAGKYYNIAKSKSILLVLEGTDMTNDIITKYNTKTQVSTTERVNKKELAPDGLRDKETFSV